MKNFILNWNFKKQLAAEIMTYGCLGMIGNAWLAKRSIGQEKTINPVKMIEEMPKRQKCFNGILLTCFVADVTASFFLLRYLKNKVK